MINNRFSWSGHIESVRGKISTKLGLPQELHVFNSFNLPLFYYGDIIWSKRGNATLMSELQVLQHKAARFTLDLPTYSSASEALKRLGWKPQVRRRMEHYAGFLYNLLNNHFCHTVPNLFNGNSLAG